MDTTLIIGSTGAAILLIGFVLEQQGIITDKSFPYEEINIVGSGLLGWYAAVLGSWPFVVLEGVWALAALWYLVRRLVGTRKNS